MDRKLSVVAVAGPTATGKTALGIGLARRYQGEIVSCDSMQVYKDLPIGTAQPTPAEQAQAPHHLVGFLEVEKPFSVSDYVSHCGYCGPGALAPSGGGHRALCALPSKRLFF